MTGVATRQTAATHDRQVALERLLKPRSVVIVGASDKPGALGAFVLGNLERNGYKGDIHLINPKRDQIGGRRCLASIDDLPSGVDAAVLAVPRAAVGDAVAQLARRHVGAAIIFSSGFAEGGQAGLAEQAEIARIADAAGMIIEGPNCLGMVNHADAIALTFVETRTRPLKGPGIGIVSQSGAMACVLSVMLQSRDLDLSYSVSTGNECASGVEDYVDYLVDDPSTRVIAMIVEQFRKPARFLEAVRRARQAGKIVVLLHPGKSAAARDSAATHTGAMAGDYQLMRTLVARAGVVIAEGLEELADVTEMALRCPVLPRGGTAILGESGAFKALMLDLCEDIELHLPAIGDADSPALRKALPEFVGVTNPLDLTAQGLADNDLYYRTLNALFDDDRFGVIVAGIIQTDPATLDIKLPPILRAVSARDAGKPVVFAGLDEGAAVPAESIAQLRDLGICYFPSPERALRAVKRLNAFSHRDGAVSAVPPTLAEGVTPGVTPEYRAKAILGKLGLPFAMSHLARTVEEATAAAGRIGYPVVLKAQSPELSHKSEAGGVAIHIRDDAQLAAAWATMVAAIESYRPGLVLDGILVEAMGAPGVEMMIGAKRDADWGPVVLVGFGGVTAELIHDVRLLPPDLTREAIRREILALKAVPLLTGFRGSLPCDIDAVADLVERVSCIMRGTPSIIEMDINPVVVFSQGLGCLALDALMVCSD